MGSIQGQPTLDVGNTLPTTPTFPPRVEKQKSFDTVSRSTRPRLGGEKSAYPATTRARQSRTQTIGGA